ncbi:hypothetical protein NFI96_007148, partial [Prochilodus magdalenae]
LLSKKRIFFENQVASSGIRSRSVVVVPGECFSLLDSVQPAETQQLMTFTIITSVTLTPPETGLSCKGCKLVNREKLLPITAHTGGSVLLPCSCTDLQTKPEELIWKKENRNTESREEISRESGQYRNRVQLVNDHSPGNLSLLISHLTEEDGGDYQCAVKDSHITIRLTVK